MEKGKIIRKVVKISLCVALALVIIFHQQIVSWLLLKQFDWLEQKTAYPNTGEYYCEELNVSIICSNDAPVIVFNDKKYSLYHNQYDPCFWGVNDRTGLPICQMLYRWDQKNDVISVTIEKFPVDYEENKIYYFRRITP